MTQKRLFGPEELGIILHRLACQLRESHSDFSSTVLIGLQPRGMALARALSQILAQDYGLQSIATGALDATFFRDDFRRRDEPIRANRTEIEHSIEGKRVVLIDDLIATGGTMMAGKKLLEKLGASVIEGAAIVDLPELGGSERIEATGLKLFTLVSFAGH